MEKKPQEWLRQADYDLDTAEVMFNAGRYFYAVYMCHPSVEKAVKGLYREKLDEMPPKVHNLVYLLNKIGIKPSEENGKFLIRLSEANIATRYPEDLDKLQRDYTAPIAQGMIARSKEILKWIKGLL
ncbi:MAG: HEPN domain-containing protein [Deltaproteobacteria bacterium]|nr:HEPN domain-containing protein [Deltaproteobacteria bacterium]